MRTNSSVNKFNGISVLFGEGKFSAVIQEGIKTPQVVAIFIQHRGLAHIKYVRRDATNLFYSCLDTTNDSNRIQKDACSKCQSHTFIPVSNYLM